MSDRRRRLLARIALVALALLVTVSAAELCLRLAPEPDGFADRVRQFSRAMLVEAPDLSHQLEPSRAVTVGGVEYRTSRLGTRGADPDGEGSHPLVLFLGDSVTMGWGVALEDAFPARFRNEMASLRSPVAVVNGGVLAYGIHQYEPRLRQLQPQVTADLVLIGYYPNDPEQTGATMRRGPLGWSRLARLVSKALGNVLVRVGAKPTAEEYYRALHAPGSETWEGVVSALDSLAEACVEFEVRCGLILIPALIGDPYPLVAEHSRIAELAGQHDMPVLDLAATYPAGDPRRFWVERDDAHPNEEAHAAYASEIAPWAQFLLRPQPE